MDSDLDALIVGAGPVGLSMAIALAMHGLRFRIIDSAPNRVNESRALGIQARTLEIFEMAGIVDEFLAQGRQLHGLHLYGESGRQIGHLRFDAVPSRYPFLMALAQSETERILGDHLSDLAVHIERQTTLLSFAQSGRSVSAILALPDGEREEVHCDWLLGCDGAQSRVRDLLNLKFAGKTYDLHFLLGDVHAECPLADNEAHIFGRKEGLFALFPLTKGFFRLVADNPPDRFRSEKKPTLEEWQEVVNTRSTVPIRLSDSGWSTYFRVNSRMVENLKRGRVFVMGDAAHIHSPALAQGMNTGIQDAWNLGWKLALVQKSLAHPTLLDSFEAERMPVERGVLGMTDFTQTMITAEKSINRFLRDSLLPLLIGFEVFQSKAAKTISETAIDYRHGPIVEDHRLPHGPHAGDRAPYATVIRQSNEEEITTISLFGRQHVLFVLVESQSEPEIRKEFESLFELIQDRYAEIVRPYLILSDEKQFIRCTVDCLIDAYGEMKKEFGAGSALYLIRPDGYIAFRCPADKSSWLTTYLAKEFLPLREHEAATR